MLSYSIYNTYSHVELFPSEVIAKKGALPDVEPSMLSLAWLLSFWEKSSV